MRRRSPRKSTRGRGEPLQGRPGVTIPRDDPANIPRERLTVHGGTGLDRPERYPKKLPEATILLPL